MTALTQVTTLNGEAFKAVDITSTRQAGISPVRNLYVNDDETKIAVVSSNDDVVKLITSVDGSKLRIENP